MVLDIQYGMNDKKLSNLKTELYSGEESLKWNTQYMNRGYVKNPIIHGRLCVIPVGFWKIENFFGSELRTKLMDAIL